MASASSPASSASNPDHPALKAALQEAAEAIREADALLIHAGAGMGVDSGLPDFRGPEGFWRAYPLFKKLGYEFQEMSTPRWFVEKPALAWGFFGHRYSLYTAAQPHEGYDILLQWAAQKPHGYHVFTSNIDGAFLTAGFAEDRVVECHGSIHHLQCVKPNFSGKKRAPRAAAAAGADCSDRIWPVPRDERGNRPTDLVTVDMDTLLAADPLPQCAGCGGLARPNVLMFNDGKWVSGRTDAQDLRSDRYLAGLRGAGARVAVVEIGAGCGVPTVRLTSEDTVKLLGSKASLIRINPREPEVPEIRAAAHMVSLPMGGLAALREIRAILAAGA